MVRVEGRHVVEGQCVRYGFPGVKVVVAVEGEALHVEASASSDTTMVDVIVDGGEAVAMAVPKDDAGLDVDLGGPGRHVVEVHKRTEGWQGLVTLCGFSTDGRFVDPPDAPQRKVLFIGDSITAGSGTDVDGLDDETDDHTVSNGRLTYARVLGDRVDAQVHLVAYGGRGLVRDWQDIRDTNNAPQFYQWSLPDDSSKPWDHRRFVPDVVSICLGTNDFNPGIPERDEWVAALVDFVETIRGSFPGVPVMLLSSPMHGVGNDLRVKHLEYLNAAAEQIDDVTVVEVGYYPGRPSDSHPIGAEHERMADDIEPTLRRLLGVAVRQDH